MPVSLSQVLSVILALAVIYYVLGLIVSAITKYALEIMKTRGKILEEFLKKNLLGMAEDGKSELLDHLKEMPQVKPFKPIRYTNAGLGFFTGSTEVIDIIERIPPKNLVDALFDLPGTIKEGNEKVQEIINLLPDKLPGIEGPIEFKIKTNLKKLADNGYEDVKALRSKMETWFSGLMEQSAQEFKARARQIVVMISLVITLVFGVDSIELAKLYWHNAALSATADAQASLILASAPDNSQNEADIQKLTTQLEEMEAINFQWYQKPSDANANWLLLKITGLLITTVAVSQGSSFWYDLIRQIKGEQTKKEDQS